LAWETYTLSQKNVLNVTDPLGIIANGGFPFSTAASGIKFNAPNFAQCSDPTAVTCTARVFASLQYWSYKVTPMDNISLRLEYFHDEQGQRTTVATRYAEVGLGWQHWFSPQVRDSAGGDLLQVLQRTRLQRQLQRDAGSPPQQVLHGARRNGHHLALLTERTQSTESMVRELE